MFSQTNALARTWYKPRDMSVLEQPCSMARGGPFRSQIKSIKSAGERSEKVELKTWQGQILKKKCLMSIWSCVSGHFTGNLSGSVSSWITFVCLFVCWNKTRKNYTPPPIGREVNPLGVVTDGQRHKPRRAYQRQRHKLRTCQSIVSFSSVQSHLFASQHFFFFRV